MLALGRNSKRKPQRSAAIRPLTSKQTCPPKAYAVDTAAELQRLMNRYQGEALDVSFRDLVSWIRVGERATHYLHSYPAKLLPQIAHFFLAASTLSKPNDIVLDPFCGTGTVALEALLAGRRALYADANPLARLIADTKTRSLPQERLAAAFTRLQTRYLRSRSNTPPDVVNLAYWYHPKTVRTLCRIKAAIAKESSSDLKQFLLVTFSAVARKVSRADPRFSVPVRKKKIGRRKSEVPPDAWNMFQDQFKANLQRQLALKEYASQLGQAQCVGNDARSLKAPGDWKAGTVDALDSGTVDLVITSPPYAGAQKYIRASSLSLGWLELAGIGRLRDLECATIGREHLTKHEQINCAATGLEDVDRFIEEVRQTNQSRAAILATYLKEMEAACREIVRVLKPGGRLVLVMGDNQVCGRQFPSSQVLAKILQGLGLELKLQLVDTIRSRGLTTKRHKSAGIITKEWILLFQKRHALK